MKYLFFLIVGCSLLLFGCEEANNNDPAVVITKISPFNHQVFDFNDTAFFKINFSDNSLITSTSLRLYLATGKDLLNMSFKPNNKIAAIDTFLIMNDSAYTFVNFDIVAEDDTGNSSSKSSHIHIRL